MFYFFINLYFCVMQDLLNYQEKVVSYLTEIVKDKEPRNLYEPVSYILELGGKRLRPILTLLAADAFNGNVDNALHAAISVEVFHNFSLVHDDIMDDAPLRRGKDTVHEKWDINTGILSGDAMLIIAYQLFEKYESKVFQDLAKLFSDTALKVCEGQQYDMDFETRNDVDIPEYIKMITYKTSVLIGAALEMGAIVSGASSDDRKAIYDFGINLGVAFQLQDDYLDAFGNPETFGKQIGGDIIENKKTFLYLNALELCSSDDKTLLLGLYNSNNIDKVEKVSTVKDIFKRSGVVNLVKEEIQNYTFRSFEFLEELKIDSDKKDMLRNFGEWLMNRNV